MAKRTAPMDRQITFQSFTTTQDAYGEETSTFADLASNPTVWARMREETGPEVIRANRVEAKQIVIWTIRYRSDITPRMQIRTGGTSGAPTGIHRIHSLREIGREVELEITTTREVG